MAKKRVEEPATKVRASAIVGVTFTEVELWLITKAAEKSGHSRMGWLRLVALREARKGVVQR